VWIVPAVSPGQVRRRRIWVATSLNGEIRTIAKAWYREDVGSFASERGQWSIGDQAYEFHVDFDDWFKERFGSTTIAPHATTSDGRTALWRLELKLNTEGQRGLERDKQEMLREADHAEIERDRDCSRSKGCHTIEFIEHYIDMPDNLVFIYGDDDEEEDKDKDKESPLIDPHLVDDAGGLARQASKRS
jgi:hypothetical protein